MPNVSYSVSFSTLYGLSVFYRFNRPLTSPYIRGFLLALTGNGATGRGEGCASSDLAEELQVQIGRDVD